jgi:signal transduction histidine kinase
VNELSNSTHEPWSASDVLGGRRPKLEELADRDSLTEACRSVHNIFGIAVRIYCIDGALIANVASEMEVCAVINASAEGRQACAKVVAGAKHAIPGDVGDVVHPCFSGLSYRIVSLDPEGEAIGRIVLGPYAPADITAAHASHMRLQKALDIAPFDEPLARVARIKADTIVRIAQHLKTTLELIVFSSYKTYVTSKLHVYSVREGYRELEEKTLHLEAALARLVELDKLKSNFLGTVSHELRTPLTSILGYSEMLAEGIAGPLSTEQAEFVQTIRSKGEQLLALISGLLDLSKLDSGTMSLRRGTLQIQPILNEVVTTLVPVARKKNVQLAFDTDDVPCELMGDSDRLRQVFVNLVDNAVKFTPSGGTVEIRARVTEATESPSEPGTALLAPVQREVEVRISDTGIGIPKNERAKVFDAFYQVDSSATREFGGTGLGLSIVKRIVEAHGGMVTVGGNEPNGAVFVVRLPSAGARRTLPSRVPPAMVALPRSRSSAL